MFLVDNDHQQDAAYLKNVSALYVEDDDEARGLLARFLARRVGRLDVATNGLEGLESFKARRQDIVITDIKVPVMDGLEMAEHIREIAADAPIIVITAGGDLDAMQRAIELEVDRYVTKPVNPELLLQAVVKSAREVHHRLEIERVNQTLTATLRQTVYALSRAIELRDPYTAGHQQRVAQLAQAIAQEMGLPHDRVHAIYLASLVHDLGKMRIPSEILVKPTKLTELEFELIKAHAQTGYELLKDIDFPWPLAEMVRQHHERLDSSGYPQGLREGEILPEALILAVADVAEAMSSDRPYRAALGIDAAVAELEQFRALRYDAAVVDACTRILKEKGDAVWPAPQAERKGQAPSAQPV